jgi:hypothetical protein
VEERPGGSHSQFAFRLRDGTHRLWLFGDFFRPSKLQPGQFLNHATVAVSHTIPMKKYGGEEVETHAFLTSALVASKLSASHPGRFTPEEKVSGNQVGGF